jgi:non-specific serine/threonine protein kinase
MLGDGVRLVTLTGPGGVGKTRLALRAAAELRAAFPHGVAVVPLEAIRDPADVAPTIAHRLGLPGAPGAPPAGELTVHLRAKRLLLVLDNFEQVVAAAPLVAALLEQCPWMAVLATSRTPLRLRAEHDLPVPPLDLPDAALQTALRHLPAAGPPAEADRRLLEALRQCAAVRLFVDRAAAVRPGFAVTWENAAAVAALCARLDGLPLALELAAARIKLLPPPTLLTRLEATGGLPLLTGGARDAPARQQTLRHTLAWSYDLLPPGDQALFRRLAVFRGGWTLAAAEAVGGGGRDGTLDGLAALVDAGLVRPPDDAPPDDGEPRYAMLQTIQEFALERLVAGGDAAAARGRHAAYYAGVAERAGPLVSGVGALGIASAGAAPRRFAAEHANLRAALPALVADGDPGAALRLAVLLEDFWGEYSSAPDGLTGFRRLTAAAQAGPEPSPALRSWLARAYACLAVFTGHVDLDHTESLAWAARARVLAADTGDPRDLAAADYVSGYAHFWAGDGGGRAFAARALATYRSLRDAPGVLRALVPYAHILLLEGQYAAGREALEEGVGLARRHGDEGTLANFLHELGSVVAHAGDDARAQTHFEEAAAIRRRLGSANLGMSLGALGMLAAAWGDDAAAGALQREAFADLASRVVTGSVGLTSHCGPPLEGLAVVALRRGDVRRAARLATASGAMAAAGYGLCTFTLRYRLDRLRQLRDAALGALAPAARAVWEAALLEGAAFDPGEPTDLAALLRFAQEPEALHAPPRRHPNGGLTPREAEVLGLLAQGKTDRQIAAALLISEKTVGRHLEHVYAKLGVTSRTAATAHALRDHLVSPA